MSIARIVRHFEALGQIPVAIPDILAQVKQDVPDEVIRVRAVDEPFNELRGLILRRKLDDSTTYMVPIYETTVVYSCRMSLKWQRVACTKELLHIVDPEPICTSSCEEIIAIANNLADKTSLKPNDFGALQTLADNLGRWQAVAALFPFGLYEELLPRFLKGEISLNQISDWTQVPYSACGVVMTPLWGHFRETILAFA